MKVADRKASPGDEIADAVGSSVFRFADPCSPVKAAVRLLLRRRRSWRAADSGKRLGKVRHALYREQSDPELDIVMWKPLTPRHAIDTMAMVVTFGEPLSSLVFRRIIRELEPTTFSKGLNNRQPMQTVSMNFSPTGPQIKPSVAPGMQFQKLSLVRVNEEMVANKVVEELIFDPTHILYRNMNYSRWENVSGTYWDMCSDALRAIIENVPIITIRLEYLDRFVFEGDLAKATARGLIKEGSSLVAPHIFDLTELWHSHTGKLEKTDGENLRLYQVNVDMVDMANADSSATRSIQIISAVEERYAGSGMEGGTTNSLRVIFDDLHERVKELFKSIVDAKLLAAVGLKNG
ncbi:hypothetical protein [Mesorhizobium sp. M0187]|uniref:hypothetical protein n=1 Tax=Mesorhizobium sp. M0187 TaxID=2956908 RepID=UPI003337C768